jgi:hypothetical protein
VKIRLTEGLADRVPRLNTRDSAHFLEAIRLTHSLSEYLPTVLLGSALSAHYEIRLQTVFELRPLLGQTEADRFFRLVRFSRNFWTNDALPLLILLIVDEDLLWPPLVACSHLLTDCGQDMAVSCFSRIIGVCELGTSFLELFEAAVECSYDRLLSSLLTVFDGAGIKVDPTLTRCAVSLTGDYQDLDLSTFLPDDNLHSELLDPSLFAALMATSDLDTIAAGAHFFLGHYEEANDLDMVETPLTDRIRSSIERALDPDPFAALTAVCKPSIVERLRLAREADPRERGELLKAISRSNRRFFRGLLDGPSSAVEAVAVVEVAVHCLKAQVSGSSLNLASFEPFFNPQHVALLSRLCDAPPPVATSTPSADALVFSPVCRPLFRSISGFTPHRFVVVSLGDISGVLHEPERSDVRAWSAFAFSLFIASPSLSLLQGVLSSYSKLLQSPNPSLLATHEAGARIVTSIRIASSLTPLSALLPVLESSVTAPSASVSPWVLDASLRAPLQVPPSPHVALIDFAVTGAAPPALPVEALHSFATRLFELDASEFGSAIAGLLAAVNARLPFSLPPRLPFASETKIWCLLDGVRRLSPDAFLLGSRGHQGTTRAFVLHKVDNSLRLSLLSQTLALFGPVFNFSYASRARGLRLSFAPAHAIGADFLLYPAPTPLAGPLEAFAGALPSRREAFAFRRALAKAFAAHAFVRVVFAAAAGRFGEVVSGADAGFLELIGDFALGAAAPAPAFFLPAAAVALCREAFAADLVLGLGAAGAACIEQTESVRAFLEAALADGASPTADAVLEAVDPVGERIRGLAPPRAPGGGPEDSRQWMGRILRIVDESKCEIDAERRELILWD